MTGEPKPSIKIVNNALKRVQSQAGGFYLDSLWLAEQVEAQTDDWENYFIPDTRFRSICVGLNQGTNAWALIYGEDQPQKLEELVGVLKKKRFRLFSAGKASNVLQDSEDVENLGHRDTSLVYFDQFAVRYALIYSRALAGEGHQLTHEIEEFAPGARAAHGAVASASHMPAP